MSRYSQNFTGQGPLSDQRQARYELQNRVSDLCLNDPPLFTHTTPERMVATEKHTMLLNYRQRIKLLNWNSHATPRPLSIFLEHFLTPLILLLLLVVLFHTASPTQDQEILGTVPLTAATITTQEWIIEWEHISQQV